MQRVHVLGPSALESLSGNTVHAVLPAFAALPGYRCFFSERAARGEEVIYIKNNNIFTRSELEELLPSLGVTRVAFPVKTGVSGYEQALKELDKLQKHKLNALIILRKDSMPSDHEFFTGHTDASVGLAIPSIPTQEGAGWGRFSAVSGLIRNKQWDMRRKYYLFGLENPAEVTAYARAFIFRVQDTLAGFISSRCYIDSLLGIPYSALIGLPHRAIDDESLLEEAYKHTIQYSTFTLNDETMKGFSTGKLGDGLWARYTQIAEREEVVYEYGG